MTITQARALVDRLPPGSTAGQVIYDGRLWDVRGGAEHGDRMMLALRSFNGRVIVTAPATDCELLEHTYPEGDDNA